MANFPYSERSLGLKLQPWERWGGAGGGVVNIGTGEGEKAARRAVAATDMTASSSAVI